MTSTDPQEGPGPQDSTEPGQGPGPQDSTEPGEGCAEELQLRPAGPEDAAAVAAVFIGSREGAGPAMPPSAHTAEEVARHQQARIALGGVWVAERDGEVVGFLDLELGWLRSLYVRPAAAGQGIGTALIGLAKALAPEGLGLWVFESNEPARRFYRRHGLVELEHTDGSANEEGCADLRMAWPGSQPMDYLRARIDEVDDELAVLLTRRAALTAAVQEFKSVPGHEGRDPERESAIANRMAERAPDLDPEAWGRIMHEVISVSLDAAERRDSR